MTERATGGRPVDEIGTSDAPQRASHPGLVVEPTDPDHPAVAALLAEARTLYPVDEHLAPGLPISGDHILNPDWHGDVAPPPPREAAVLIALGPSASGELGVVLTERAGHLAAHAGQVALPGGKLEPGETPAMAALREAEEEVALPPAAVRPLGLVEPYLTRTGFMVVPVLALLTERAVLRPHPGEVSDIFLAPWVRVMDAAFRSEEVYTLEGRPRRFYQTMVGERCVWGVTAGIFKVVSERLYRP